MTHGKVLILGASGFIGRRLVKRVGPGGCVATYNSKHQEGWHRFDGRIDDVAALPLDDVSHAVILLGDTSPDSCARDASASEQLNVRGIIRIADILEQRNIKVVFTSSDAVFDGIKGNYSEDDEARPLLVYGQQKKAVEAHLYHCWPHALTLRLPKIYGSHPGDGSLIDDLYQRAVQGQVIRCAADFISSLLHVEDAVTGILAAIDHGLSGLYHLAGPQPLSRVDLCRSLLAAMGDYGPVSARIQACSIDDFPTLEGRPKNISMDGSHLCGVLGLTFRTVDASCREYMTRLCQINCGEKP